MTYRDHLPQLDGGVFLTDGGLETTLIFHDGVDLPAFAAFPLLEDAAGVERLRRYYDEYAVLARERDLGFVLEAPTWRANARWGAEVGYDPDRLAAINREAIALMEAVRDARAADDVPVVVSGCLGPHDDAYDPAQRLSADAAQRYHAAQIETFADTAADMVAALTLTSADEAIGIARAARDAGIPSAISFTVETDGRLPSGEELGEAIEAVDAATGAAPAYYMINCAHPTHFAAVLQADGPWRERVLGLRANASAKSHAELDEATELDAGDPRDLGARYVELADALPRLTVLGGCCGTDERHVRAIRDAWLAAS